MDVCQAYENYGKSHHDCEWGFTRRARNEKYCDPCKPFIKRIQKALAQRKYMAGGVLLPDAEELNFAWTASHIDKRCSRCGNKGVPVQNRFLCVPCFTSDEARRIEVGLQPRYGGAVLDFIEIDEIEVVPAPSDVKIYSSDNMSQEELRSILDGK